MDHDDRQAETAVARLLPEINLSYSAALLWRTLCRTSLVKTIWYSVRNQGFIIVGHRAHIRMAKHSRIVLRKRAMLIVGIDWNLPEHSLVELDTNATLFVDGTVTVNRGSSLILGRDATMRIGHHTFFNDRCFVLSRLNMVIGKDCAIGRNVNIFDSDEHEILRSGKLQPISKDIVIGDRVWIGTGVTVLKGSNISDGAIIGAGSIVTADIPSGTISVGSPARVIVTDATWKV